MRILVRPLGISIVLFLSLLLVDAILGQDQATTVTSAALLAVPLFDWACAILLLNAAARNPQLGVLRSASEWALFIAIGASAIWIIALSTLVLHFTHIHVLPTRVLAFLLLIGLVIPSVRSLLWLWDWWRGKL